MRIEITPEEAYGENPTVSRVVLNEDNGPDDEVCQGDSCGWIATSTVAIGDFEFHYCDTHVGQGLIDQLWPVNGD